MKQTLTNKQHWVLSVPLPTGISHLQLGQSSYCSGRLGQSLTSTALAIINTTHWGGIPHSEGTNFGRCEQKVSRVGAAVTSSVRSFQSLIAFRKRRISCSQFDRRSLGIRGNGNDGLLWHWDSNLVFTWCHWLWSLVDGGTYKSLPVLLSCAHVGDMVSPALPACCWHWICCGISVVCAMLPFAVQTLVSWSAWCLGPR